MPARPYNIVVEQGSDYTLTIPTLNSSGNPLTVTTWTAAGHVRPYAGSTTLLAELDVSMGDTSVVLRIPHATSRDWDFRTAYYDIELTSPDGLNVTRILSGLVIVRAEITV